MARMRINSVIAAALLLLPGLVLAPEASATPHDQRGPHEVVITNADRGTTVTVRPGELVTVSLRSTFWDARTITGKRLVRTTGPWFDFAETDARSAAPQGDPQYAVVAGSQPGKYLGTSTMRYRAHSPGQTALTAESQTTYVCGSKRLCNPVVWVNRFTVTLEVTPPRGSTQRAS